MNPNETNGDLFGLPTIPPTLAAELRRFNPWWEKKPGFPLPTSRRHLVSQIRRRLDMRLAPVIVVRGPRQIGKSTAQQQLIGDFLDEGISPFHILRVQFDDLGSLRKLDEPILRIIEWYEGTVLGRSLNEVAQQGRPALLFFDEIQNLDNWAPQLKALVDSSAVQVVVTGSSALRIELGRDSLAGRITTIEAGTLSLSEIAALRGDPFPPPHLPDNGLDPLARIDFWRALVSLGAAHRKDRDRVFAAFSERGSYPIAHLRSDAPWSAVADQLNETVIRRVIQHDLRLSARGGAKRDAALLEQVFRTACRYIGQCPKPRAFAEEAQQVLDANVGVQRTSEYLRFLAGALLIHLIEPMEIRLKKQRSAPKICLCDHGLRAAWLQEIVPLDSVKLAGAESVAVLAGHIAESVVGSLFKTISGLDVSHFPERSKEEQEIDFVLTLGSKRIPIEVKYRRRIDSRADTAGLRSMLDRPMNNAPFGILVTREDEAFVDDPRIVAMPLSTLMMLR